MMNLTNRTAIVVKYTFQPSAEAVTEDMQRREYLGELWQKVLAADTLRPGSLMHIALPNQPAGDCPGEVRVWGKFEGADGSITFAGPEGLQVLNVFSAGPYAPIGHRFHAMEIMFAGERIKIQPYVDMDAGTTETSPFRIEIMF